MKQRDVATVKTAQLETMDHHSLPRARPPRHDLHVSCRLIFCPSVDLAAVTFCGGTVEVEGESELELARV